MPSGIYERTKKLNRITIDEDNPNKAYIHIESKTHGSLKASITASRVDMVKNYTWRVSKVGSGLYVMTNIRINGKEKKLYLHRLLTGDVKGMVVDHENHDTLCNQDWNLRVCTHQENMMNQGSNKNTSSKYCGVYWNKKEKKWHAQIQHNGKKMHLGLFDIEEEAARRYDRACIELHGSFGQLNFPLSDYQ